MTLYRVEHNKDNPYLVINTTIVRDNRLSWKAKALWFYAFSQKDDWQFYQADLIKQSVDGRDSVRAGLNELEETGYLVRNQNRAKGKYSSSAWTFFETPKTEEEIKKLVPRTGFPSTVNQTTANPPLTSINKKLVIKEDTNISKIKEEKAAASPPPSMSFSTKTKKPKKKIENPRDFLATEQKPYFDRLLKYVPHRGEKLVAESVSFWIKKWGIDRVKEGIDIYEQQIQKHLKNPGKVPAVESMGAYVRTALNNGIKPENEDFMANKAYAEKLSKEYSFLEITKKYVKIVARSLQDELLFVMPAELFTRRLNEKVCCAQDYI